MGKPGGRFVGKAEAGRGWRIWDNKMKKWWGERLAVYPEQLLAELNGGKRPDELTKLIKSTPRQRD